MRRFCAVLAAFSLLGAARAGAVTLVTPEGQVAQPYQRWADRARVPTPDRMVVVRDEGCPGMEEPACAIPGQIWLDGRWFRRFEPGEMRDTFLHEMGHEFDYFVMTAPAREAFGRLLRDERPWLTDAANPPRELFAEAWDMCARAKPPTFEGRVDAGLGYLPTLPVHRRVCALIRRAGGWFMWPIRTGRTSAPRS